jgi:hypothetical protein
VQSGPGCFIEKFLLNLEQASVGKRGPTISIDGYIDQAAEVKKRLPAGGARILAVSPGWAHHFDITIRGFQIMAQVRVAKSHRFQKLLSRPQQERIFEGVLFKVFFWHPRNVAQLASLLLISQAIELISFTICRRAKSSVTLFC